MDNGNWEIGVGRGGLEELLSGESAAMTLWFLAGYLKGLTDGNDLGGDVLRMVLEPDGDGSWRLRSSALPSMARVQKADAQDLEDHPAN